MPRIFCRATTAVAFLLTIAAGSATGEPLLDPSATDWAALIGPPPAAGSAVAREDLAVVLWVQRTRSEADVDRAWAAMSPNAASFQQAVGTMLLPQVYPGIYAALQAGLDATTPVFFSLKNRWDRPRPTAVDERVKPCTPTPSSGSYPSGSAALGVVASRLLADLVPSRRAAILARGEEIAALRVTAGVHFPTDVESGSKLGHAIADQILGSKGWAAHRASTEKERERLARTIAAHGTDG